MKALKFNKIIKIFVVFKLAVLFIFSANNFYSQSTNQDFPTPVATNEIRGEIKPRAIGDPRLTNYYYTFSGNQGDVFINVVTSNLDGDIDVFTVRNLEPLTKIPVFAGVQENETGRVIYLRKSENLILRIQGRTPNDDPAKFQIKFAGSFVPLEGVSNINDSQLPQVNVENQGEAQVNSVGTIIKVFPKEIESPKSKINARIENKDTEKIELPAKEITVSATDDKENPENATMIEIRKEEVGEPEDEIAKNTVPKVIITDEFEKTTEERGKSDADKTDIAETENPFEVDETVKAEPEESVAENSVVVEDLKEVTSEKVEIQPVEPGKLANISLLVKFKNGTKFKRSMDKITWFNVDKGILTIVTDDGTILKFSMLDVEKMTFEAGK